ncbi:hypothetical protein AMS68_003743 [Peltaster fructicola]|uniref:Uncharacterized protein n=1 Tax=Peltaster fructicola TaxID=286661 RepID=A0A6H0XU69_9PEZI|nr:hypothetical protein AMS68_003743 [Peltaster fructicola]
MSSRESLSSSKLYAVAIITALPLERAAVLMMLDQRHDIPQNFYQQAADSNAYSWGTIGRHNVVIASLAAGEYGKASAAKTVEGIRFSLPHIRIGLFVGIGAGLPGDHRSQSGVISVKKDIRVGDVVVSLPEGTSGGVVQYDLHKRKRTIDGGQALERVGHLDQPPTALLKALSALRAEHSIGDRRLEEFMAVFDGKPITKKYRYPGLAKDPLKDAWKNAGFDNDDRKPPVIHYGLIASGDGLIKDAVARHEIVMNLAKENLDPLCLEMEAAGIMNNFPCLVIRGISDYANEQKNDDWREHAAGVAAAYAKELLMTMPVSGVANTRTIDESMRLPEVIVQLPFPKNRHFVGREAALEQLEQRLLIKKDCQKLAIVGLGGVGKTQVALSFAYHVKDKCPTYSIFWISAVSKETIEQGFTEIARLLHICTSLDGAEDIKVLVQQRLSMTAAGEWIIIVDNVDDASVLQTSGTSTGLMQHLPQNGLGIILFTTRDRRIAQSIVGSDVVEIMKMDQQEASRYLSSALTTHQLEYGDEKSLATLLDQLDHLPLAITQAAAYMNTNVVTVSEYLRLLQNTEHDLIYMMSVELGDSTRYEQAANAVASTWVVSFNQIVQDSAAASLLEFISCIEWKAIPYSILPEIQPEARLISAIGTLCAYSFVSKRDAERMYDMHRLVHLAARIWYGKNSQVHEIRREAIRHLCDVFPSDEYSNRRIWREYIPHVSKTLEDVQDDEVIQISSLCVWVGKCLMVDGRIREALSRLEQAQRCTQRLAQDHILRLLSQHELASAYHDDGQIKKAVQLLEHVVRVRESVLAEDHSDHLASQHALAGAYLADGQVKKAVELLEHVVRVRESVLAEDHSDHLASQHALAGAYLADGQVKKAVELLEHVVRVRESVLAEDHPDRLASQHELAGAYRANGQIKKAVELLEHVVRVRSMLAEDHPSRLASQHQLAGAYSADGQVKKAVELLEHVVRVRSVLAEDHPDRLTSQHELAVAYEADGQVKRAIELLEEVASRKTIACGPEHPTTLTSLQVVGAILAEQGRMQEAREMLTRCAEARTRVLGGDHPNTINTLDWLRWIDKQQSPS